MGVGWAGGVIDGGRGAMAGAGRRQARGGRPTRGEPEAAGRRMAGRVGKAAVEERCAHGGWAVGAGHAPTPSGGVGPAA